MGLNTVDPKQAEKEAFKEKLKSLHFGTVPGAYRQSASRTYYDVSALPDFPSKEEVMDNRADIRRAPIREVRLDATTGRPETRSGS